jgi:hypothetical protein
MVVLTGIWDPAANSASTPAAGDGSGSTRTIRLGSCPPSACRRSRM